MTSISLFRWKTPMSSVSEVAPRNTDKVPPMPQHAPVALFAVAAGVIITNMFAPQTLVGLMAASIGVETSMSGLIAMIPFLGYAAGLFFLVPLADLVENRRLVLQMLSAA